MGLFLLDVLYGVLLVISMSASVAGLLAYRYRREAGPFFLLVSGIPGVLSSVLFILDSSNATDIPLWVPFLCLALFLLLILAAVVRWRGRR